MPGGHSTTSVNSCWVEKGKEKGDDLERELCTCTKFGVTIHRDVLLREGGLCKTFESASAL